jgi:hypothetical protein
LNNFQNTDSNRLDSEPFPENIEAEIYPLALILLEAVKFVKGCITLSANI